MIKRLIFDGLTLETYVSSSDTLQVIYRFTYFQIGLSKCVKHFGWMKVDLQSFNFV